MLRFGRLKISQIKASQVCFKIPMSTTMSIAIIFLKSRQIQTSKIPVNRYSLIFEFVAHKSQTLNQDFVHNWNLPYNVMNPSLELKISDFFEILIAFDEKWPWTGGSEQKYDWSN